MEPSQLLQSQSVQVVLGKKISREEVIKTLIVEGGIIFSAAAKMEDISDETLLSAAIQVIDAIAEQRDKTLDDLKAEVELTRQFYNAAQRANMRVTRDESGKIKLEAAR
jgi:hypothetical protein